MDERVDAPDLVPTDEGIEEYTDSGHVSGPYDADEIALLDARADADRE